jgi:hypothetical protein
MMHGNEVHKRNSLQKERKGQSRSKEKTERLPFLTQIHYKMRAEANRLAIALREEKKGEQLRTMGHYGEGARDWEEEGDEGRGREQREEA